MTASKKSKPRAKREAPKRRAKPALGNDPFERGAALRTMPAEREEKPALRGGEEVEPRAAIEVPAPAPTAVPTPTPAEAPAPALTETPSPSQPEAIAPAATRAEPPTPIEAEATAAAPPAPTPTPTQATAPDLTEAPSPSQPEAPAPAPSEIPEPAATPAPSPPRSRLASVERRVADELGRATRQGLALLRSLGRIAPAALEKLGGLAAVRRVLEPAADLDPSGMDRELAAQAAPLREFLYATWWRVEARRIENVPAAGPALVIANHGGALPWDALVLRVALGREHPAHRDLRPLLHEDALRTPLVGGLAARLGAVPATPENALRLLREGGAAAFFPEGPHTGDRPWAQRYRVQQFGRGGFAKIALRAGAVIVPCAVVGSEETSAPPARAGWLGESLGLPMLAATPLLPLRALGLLPLPARWSLRFGEPIATESLGPGAADDPHAVFDLTERTRAALQQMLDEDVAARRSVYL